MKTITIKQGCLGRYDDVSPFLVEDGTLALHIVLPRVGGEFYFIAWNSFDGGQNKRTIKIPATGDVELSGIQAGELHAEVKHYFRGELVETFPVEPLLSKSVDGSVRAFPEIVALQRQYDALLETLETREEAAQKTIGKLKAEIHDLKLAFLSYAWAEYQSDVQLNAKGVPLSRFLELCGGGEFTEEEIKKIKAFKEDL